jgi:competence protein ComGC
MLRVLLVLVLVLVLMVLLLLLLLLLVVVPVSVRWVRRRVLREGRGWLVGWVVRRRKRSSETKREAGMAICARHGDRRKYNR